MENKDNPYAAPTTDAAKAEQRDVDHSGALATLSQRFVGSLIDSLVLIAAVVPVAIAFFFAANMLIPWYAVEDEITPSVWILETAIAMLAASICFLAINGYLLHSRGQTVGKLAMKTRIVSNRGQLVPLPKLFLSRYLLLWGLVMIPLIGNFISLIDALFIFRENRKCLHDEFAGTQVVMVYGPPKRELPDKIEIPDF
jgi:uncharacterized RDD family membrane protein YckC